MIHLLKQAAKQEWSVSSFQTFVGDFSFLSRNGCHISFENIQKYFFNIEYLLKFTQNIC